MTRVMDDPRVKIAGAVVLAALVGFAVGNGHATSDALKGSAEYWQKHERADLTAGERQAWQQCVASYWK